MAKKRKKIFFWIGCFAVPVLLMLAVYIRLGIYPFGSHSLLTSDMSSQYAAFFSAYRRTILEEGGNFLYSFQKSLGGNMLGLFAYYLASPLNVLLLLFPPDSLTEGILCLTLLKLGLSSVSFAYFLRRTFCSRPIHTLLFSWMYALCSYNIVYQQNLMWLDGVIFLPIVIWGLEKIIRGERGCLYSAVLALTLISNYYIGYMICIFCILYFIYRVLLNGKQQNGLRKQMTAFIGHSALSGGISAFLLLPTFADLLISKASEPGTAAHGLKFMPWDLFSKLYIGAFDYTDMQYGLPNIYCGVLAAILLLFYFFNRRILRREKLFSAGLLAVLIISMSADTINRIWHGMQEPIWFPYRYSFILSFLVLCLAYRALVHMEAVEPLPLFGVLSLWVIAGVLAGEKRFISQGQVGITLLFASVYLLILTLYFYSRQHVIIYILTFLVCTELTGNALLSLGRLPYDERAEYSDFIERVGPAVDQYAADGSNTFYRMEKQFRLTKNDPMLLGYPGILHFSSTHQTNVTELARKLGIASSTHNKTMVAYQGSTPVTDMVFGIRYLFSEEPVPGYQPIEEKNGYTVYQNPYALPLGFMVPELPEDLTLDKAYFAHNQQELVRLLTGKKLKLLYRQPEVQKVAEGVYQFEATTYFPVYGQAREVILNHKGLKINGEDYAADPYGMTEQMIYLGTFSPGETVTLEISEKAASLLERPFYALDIETLEEAYQQLSKNSFSPSVYTNTRLSGSIRADQDGMLLFTIPYDQGWRITVDGKRIPAETALGALTSIPLSAGQHQVTLQYIPSGFLAGCLLSALSLGVWAVICFRCRDRQII